MNTQSQVIEINKPAKNCHLPNPILRTILILPQHSKHVQTSITPALLHIEVTGYSWLVFGQLCNISLFSSTRESDGENGSVIRFIGDQYSSFTEETWVINAFGAALVALAILIPWILGCPAFGKGLKREGRRYDGGI